MVFIVGTPFAYTYSIYIPKTVITNKFYDYITLMSTERKTLKTNQLSDKYYLAYTSVHPVLSHRSAYCYASPPVYVSVLMSETKDTRHI